MISKVSLGIGLFLLVMVLGGWIIGGILAVRLTQLEIQTNRLAARLLIQPRDVLCSVSAQVAVLYEIMARHCETTHGVDLTPLAPPSICGKLPPNLRPQRVEPSP